MSTVAPLSVQQYILAHTQGPLNNSLPPPPLTAGMPSPEAIQKQKDAYIKILEDQLAQGVNALDTQVKNQKEYSAAQAEQRKKQFIMQVENQAKQQELQLLQKHAEQRLALLRQAAQQKAVLEQQATALTLEYQKKKAEEDVQNLQFEMERQHSDVQVQMVTEMHSRGYPQGAALLQPSGGLLSSVSPLSSHSHSSFHFVRVGTPHARLCVKNQSFSSLYRQPSFAVRTGSGGEKTTTTTTTKSADVPFINGFLSDNSRSGTHNEKAPLESCEQK